jgi:hypothetical protein
MCDDWFCGLASVAVAAAAGAFYLVVVVVPMLKTPGFCSAVFLGLGQR